MRRLNLLLAVFLLIVTTTSLRADSATWTGAINSDWNTDGNWTAPFPNGAADDATLNAAAATGATINVSSAIDLNSLSTNTNPSITGAAITFNGAGTKITNSVVNFLTINNAIVLPDGEAVTFTATPGGVILLAGGVSGSPTSVTVSSGITTFLSTAPTFTGTLSIAGVVNAQTGFAATAVTGTGILQFTSVTTTYAGDISGTLSLTKTGTGNVTLSGTNTYSGTTSITGGTLTGTTSSLPSTSNISNGGALVFDQSTNGTYSGIISSTGTVTKQGTGNVTLSNTSNSWSGGTTITAGTLTGTTSTIPATNGVANSGTLAFSQNADGAFSGAITGTGAVTKLGTGNVTLSSTSNTYSGGTTISAGTITGTTGTIPSSGGVANSGTFVLDQNSNGTYSGVISGTGAFTKSGTGNVTLSGTNTYTGVTTISAGTLTGTTSSIPSGSNVTNGAALVFNQSTNGTYSGVISSTGTLTKSGTGIVTLSNTNTYTGDTTVSGGTLSVTGAIANGSTTTVQTGATLRGSGSVGPVTNAANGTVQAGISAGNTLTVNGAYSQTATSTMKSIISPSAASRLVATGTATLAGTLELDVGAGAYPGGTSFTVLSAGSITDNFTTLTESHEGDWQLSKVGNTVVVTLLASEVVTPVPLSDLKGNDRVMGDYIFLDPNFVTSNSDLTIVSNVMLTQGDEVFKDSLIRVSPVSTAALPQTQLQGDVQVAVVLDKQFQKTINEERKGEVPCYGMPNTGLFIEPIGVFYHQRAIDGDITNTGQIAFDSYTYGAGGGWEQVLNDMFVVEGGIGYTHSNLHWHRDFGNSRWSTIYVAPFFGWFNKRFYGNFMVMGAINFFKTSREIFVPPIKRYATSRYKSYDILLRLNGGARIPFGNINWFQPDVTLNYLTIFTEGYTESGASSISLQVKRRTNYIMQPSFRAKWIQEFKTEKFCYSPIIYVGWLANILLQSDNVSARFKDAPNQIFFTVSGYRGTTNQLILGAEFFAQRFEKFEITGTFEVDMLSKFEVYTGKIRFQWFF